MDIRSLQRPLKDLYRQDPATSCQYVESMPVSIRKTFPSKRLRICPIFRITLTAHGTQTDTPIACSVDLGRAIYEAQAHKGVGGAGTGACSGDLLLGALAACAHISCQMVAAAMSIPIEGIDVRSRAIWICRNAGNIERDFRRISEHQSHFRRPCTACNGGAVKRVAGENGTILCGDANLAAPAQD
ncbi:MAG: hypothetical protein WB660_26250 [Candidatus Sulfotelmatobacter sp.]